LQRSKTKEQLQSEFSYEPPLEKAPRFCRTRLNISSAARFPGGPKGANVKDALQRCRGAGSLSIRCWKGSDSKCFAQCSQAAGAERVTTHGTKRCHECDLLGLTIEAALGSCRITCSRFSCITTATALRRP